MTQNEILAANQTKTWKIEQLLKLGLSRKDVAALVTNGNYGFVQNVYAKMLRNQLMVSARVFDRKFGVEIEAYGVDKQVVAQALNRAGIQTEVQSYNHDTRACWKIVTDGSVTGVSAWELVSPVLQGEAGLEQLRIVSDVLVSLRVKINKSCGLHIHFDASQMNLQAWKQLYSNYAAIEPLIDSMMPESRRANNNGYCRSIIDKVAEVRTATTISEISRKVSSRYYKINAQSYLRHKTVEFRQHSGTIEFQKISNWVMFLHHLLLRSEQGQTVNSLAFLPEEQATFYHNRIQDLAA